MTKEWKEENVEMCNYSEYVWNQGIAKGENLLAMLINRLLTDNRLDDVKLATTDEDARQQFYEEYGIVKS